METPRQHRLSDSVVVEGNTDNRNSLFVVKADSNGNYVWGKPIRGEISNGSSLLGDQNIERTSIRALADDSVLVAGHFWQTIAFDDINKAFTAAQTGSKKDSFVAKLSSAGVFEWATHISAAASEVINDIDSYADGSSIITGFFDERLTIGDAFLEGRSGRGLFAPKNLTVDLPFRSKVIDELEILLSR